MVLHTERHPMTVKKIAVIDLTGVIRNRRRELGLTQKSLGQLLGIDQRTVSSLEKNPGSISVNRLFAVFNALQVQTYVSGDPKDEFQIQRLMMDAQFRRNRLL